MNEVKTLESASFGNAQESDMHGPRRMRLTKALSMALTLWNMSIPTAAAQGATRIRFNPSEAQVKFRVNDGCDLDQFMGSSVYFSVNAAHCPIGDSLANPTLAMRARSKKIDDACGSAQSKVWSNDEQVGTFESTSTETKVVNLGLNPGCLEKKPTFQGFLVEPGVDAECWEFQVFWAETQAAFNVGQVSAWATENFPVLVGPEECIGEIWQTGFNSGDGALVPSDDSGCPVADVSALDGEFNCKFQVMTYPKPAGWTTKVDCKWKCEESTMNSGNDWQTSTAESDGIHSFPVFLPELQVDGVGAHTLLIALQVYMDPSPVSDGDKFNGVKLLRMETRNHTVFALLNKPIDTSDITCKPLLSWLEAAVPWAQGARDECEVMVNLCKSIHSNPYNWGYGDEGGEIGETIDLIEQKAGNGICSDFAKVWRLLSGCHGMVTEEFKYDRKPEFVAFLTNTKLALDGGECANARNKATGECDRWLFTNHELGLNHDRTNFFDPTFGIIGSFSDDKIQAGDYSDVEGNVFCTVHEDDYGQNASICRTLTETKSEIIQVFKTGNPICGMWYEFEYEPSVTQVGKHILVVITRALDSNSSPSLESALNDIEEDVGDALEAFRKSPPERELAMHHIQQAMFHLTPSFRRDNAVIAEDLLKLLTWTGRGVAVDAIDGCMDTKFLTQAKQFLAKGDTRLEEWSFKKAVKMYLKTVRMAEKD